MIAREERAGDRKKDCEVKEGPQVLGRRRTEAFKIMEEEQGKMGKDLFIKVLWWWKKEALEIKAGPGREGWLW